MNSFFQTLAFTYLLYPILGLLLVGLGIFDTKIKKKTERGRIINKKCKIQSHSASSIIDILTFCHLVFSMWLVAHFSESTPGFSGKSAVFTILQEQKNIREHIF